MWKEVAIAVASISVTKLIMFVRQRMYQHGLFLRVGIPGPSPSFFNGNFYELHRNKNKLMPHEVMHMWIKQYGRRVGFYEGGKGFLILHDLDLLQEVFIRKTTKFRNRPEMVVNAKPMNKSVLFLLDDNWKRVRRIISPLFGHHKSTTHQVTRAIEGCIERLMQSLEDNATHLPNGSFQVPMYPRLQATTLDAITATTLNMNSINFHSPKDTFLKAVKDYFSGAQNKAVEFAIVFPFLRPVMTFINDHLTSGKMTDVIVNHLKKQIVQECDSEDLQKSPFLHSLIQCLQEGKLSSEEVIANAHIILLAGYETTANAITFILMELAHNPKIQEKLRLYFEGLYSHPDGDYFEMIWLEGLRILPPVSLFVTREASEDVVIGTLKIEKGTIIQAPVWEIQHDPDIWEDPMTFDPERFTNSRRTTRHPMSFLAFGAGPRVCLGSHFALYETKLVVKNLLCKYQVSVPEDTPEIEIVTSNVFVNPKGDAPLIFTPLSGTGTGNGHGSDFVYVNDEEPESLNISHKDAIDER